MTKEPKPLPHGIKQPKLNTLKPNERVVRVAGLKFILPCNWKPGDVLDEDTAKFLNAAHHTAVINGFAETRRELLSNKKTTYDDLDAALQGFFETYKRTTRELNAGDPRPGRTEEERALIAYARPHFNKVVGGKGVPRKEYEARLADFVNQHRKQLEASMKKERQALEELTSKLSTL